MQGPHGYHVIVASEPVSTLISTKYSLNERYFVALVKGQWLLLKNGQFIHGGQEETQGIMG